MSKGETMTHVRNGFRTAGAWLLGFAWLFLVFAGMGIAFSSSPHSPVMGWVLLAIAAIGLVVTADHWVKAFPGLMIVATFNSLIMISSGHSIGSPAVLVPRWMAVGGAVAFAVATALSYTFRGRRLGVVDRLALLALPASIVWGAIDQHVALPALAGGVGCLFLAWAYGRIRHHGGPNHRASHADPMTVR